MAKVTAEPAPPAPRVTSTRTMPKEPITPTTTKQTTNDPPAALATPPKEIQAKPFVPRNTEHFLVRFDGSDAPDVWTQIRSILEYAYQDISQKFGHTPASPIQVVLHTAQAFPAEIGTPAWADSQFDTTTATIHIPTIGAMEDLALLSRVARHEFAHALIQEKMGKQNHALPTWLAEGLAIQLAEDPWPDLDDIKEKSAPLIPLSSLHGRWDQIPKQSLAVAYFESALASQKLIDRHNMYGVRQVMNGVLTGLSFDAAIQQKLSTPYTDFIHHWEGSALSAGLQKQ